jgi:hypothetical protein
LPNFNYLITGLTRSTTYTPACDQSAYHYYRNFYSTSTATGSITSPNLTAASNGGEISISFVYKANEWDIEYGFDLDMFVEYSTDNSTWNQVGSTINISGIGTTEQWSLPCTTFTETIAAGTVPAGSDFKFRIRAQWNSGDGRLGIDNISLTQESTTPPNCATALLPANEAENVILNPTLTWTDGGGIPTSFDVYFGTTANPALVANVTSTSYAPQAPLAANTTYFWKIVSKNSIGDAIGCVEQSFTTGTNLVYCTPTGASNNTDEIRNFTLNNLNNDSAASEGTAGYKDYTTTVAPANILTGVPTVASLTSGPGSGNHGAAIWIDFNQNGTFEASEKVTFIDNTIAASTTAQFPAFTITSDITPGTYRLRVQYRFNNSGEVLDPCVASTYSEIEDYLVNILPEPTCFPPTDLSVLSLTFNSATLAWVSDGSLFDIEYGVSGFTPTGNPSTGYAGISGTTHTLTGLEAETNYQYYVRQDCGDGDLSIWAGPFSFYTGYCTVTTSNPTSTSYKIIGFSTTEGYTNITNEAANGNTTTAADIYNNYSNMAVTQSPGGTFNYSVTVMAYAELEIWIDLNQDMIFDPTEELLISYDDYASSVHTYTGSYTIPAGTPLGDYRMRVRSRYYSSAVSPCGSVTYGETEDYTISVVETPSCLPPSDVTVTGLTFNSATLAWTGTSTSTFDIEYGVAGFTPTETPSTGYAGISGTTETITGLDADTNYQFYIRQDCGEGDTSHWAGPYSFYTGYCTVTTSNPTSTSYKIIGFSTTEGYTNITNEAANGNTTTAADIYNNYSNMAVTQSPGGTFNYSVTVMAYAELEIWIDLNQDMIFDPTEELLISYDDYATSVHTYTGSYTIPAGTPLGDYRMRVRSRYYTSAVSPCGSVTYGETEDYTISVVEAPSCMPVTGITGTSFSTTTGELSWTSTGTLFDIEYGVSGFTPTGIPTESGVNNPHTVTTPTSGAYDFYVRQNCGNDDTSLWVGPYTLVIGAYSEGDIPSMYAAAADITVNSTNFCTPEPTITIDVPEGYQIAGLQVQYKMKANTAAESGATSAAYMSEQRTFIYSPTLNMGEPTITSGTGASAGIMNYNRSMDFANGATGSVDFVLRAWRTWQGFEGCNTIVNYVLNGTWVITPTFEPIPSCPKPIGLNAVVTALDTAELSWMSSGTLFDIEYDLAGFTPTGEPSTDLTGVSNNYTLTGLTADTNYQYYVRQNCGDEVSDWAGPFNFYTGYCIATSTGTSYRITGFATTGGYTNIDNLNNGTSAGYNNYSNMIVTQSEGNTFNYTITVPAYTNVEIWIDIDQNLIFELENELLAPHTEYGTVATTYTGNFTIPMGLPLGDYRMRVRSRYYNNAANPCGTAASGETEDYTLRIIETPTCLPVTEMSVGDISHNSAELLWTIAEGTSFDIEFGEAGFEPTGEPSTGLTEVSNPYTLTGLTPLTTYEYYVRQNCGIVGESTENVGSLWVGPFSFSTECLPPNLPVPTQGEVCGMGEVTLTATADADATIAWYDAEEGGNKLGEGETFTTPVISETTSYWVAAYTDGGSENIGPLNPTILGAGGYQSLDYYIYFTVNNATTIESVDIFTNSALGTQGGIVIKNMSDNSTVGTYNFTVTQTGSLTTGQTVVINQPLAPGNYSMGMAGTSVSLYRNTAGATFPYTGTDVELTGNSFSGYPQYFYYFYNWAVSSGCASDRVEVVATVTAPPALELSTNEISICEGETPDTVTIVTGADDYDTFVWEPSTGVTGDATTGWSFSPAETTTYTLTVSQTEGASCATTTTLVINVNPLPTAITVVGNEDACVDSIAALTVAGNIVNGTAIFGEGTTAPGTTSWPNPFSKFYGGTKHQMLFTAAELEAQGLVQGSEITAVTFDLAAINTSANNVCTDFTIRMGNTTVTEMTGLISGTTDVYGPLSFIPTETGIVTFNLTTPYLWDGVSNIVVETVHNTGNGGLGSGTTTKTSPTPNNSVYRVAKDNVAGGVPGFDATTYTVVGAHNIRPNMTFVHSMEQTMITWEPATNLYTDAAATVPYVSGEYAQVVYFKPTAEGDVTYTATSSTEFGCTVSDAITIAVGPAIVAPTGATTQTLENGDTLADLVVNGTNLVWYADAALTQVIPNTTEAVDGTTYYVVSESGACQSASLAITVIIDPCTMLAAPTGNTAQSVMLGDTIAELDVTGTNLVWYADANLTTVIPNTTVAVNGTTYYVVATTEDCQSAALAITVTVIDPCADVVTPTGAATQTVLVGATIASLVVDGDNLVWYADEALTTVITEATLLVNGTTYYVVAETAECQSDALAITVTVIDPCAEVVAPTGDAIQTVAEGTTLAELEVNGTSLAWYADAELTQSLVATTVVETGVTYYVASVTDICQSEPLAITVIIEGTNPCEGVTVPAPTGDEAQTLTEGQTLADLVVEGENLQWYADADLTEALEETHIAEDDTTYYVTQTIGVCTSEALAVTVDVTLGRTDFETFAFRFYPNPVGDVLNLTSNSEISQINLFNMLGQKVTVVANANNTQVDMSGLPTGNYIITVTIEGVTKTFKVVKN